MTNLDSILKSRDITLSTKVHLVKAMVFSSSHVWMWELDYKKSWAQKNWCFWTVVSEKTLESPLGCKKIQPVNPKGSVLSIHWKGWCWSWSSNTLATSYEDLDAGKVFRQEKGPTEDEVVGWHHRLNRHEFEQVPGDGEGQGSLVCCNPWGLKKSDTTDRLNSNSHQAT